MENFELVQRGFRVLLTSFSGYIGQQLSKVYDTGWWNEVLSTLYDQRYDLPYSGTYGELVDSLDIANCIRLLDRKWNDVFSLQLSKNCRTWARELMGVRNIVSHAGQQDLEQPMAERALDTMALLCKEMDSEGEAEIREIYRICRSKAEGSTANTAVFEGIAQPASESGRGELSEGSLLQLVGTDAVQKTTLTRKVTYNGKTVIYPVYKVRLDALYYNDQNDRISTWISRYESENGKDSLIGLDRDIYNRIIENFITESNFEAIVKTQKNISLVGQREPGVTLADGRIVDGNRRYTCLRRLAREQAQDVYFETVIMDMDIRADKKQIKLLELAIQHGEEKKVDYDLIDFAIGTYRDIVETELLSIEEYASGTNEPLAEIRKRIDVVVLIFEFLSYIKLTGHYHIARELQLYSIFQETLSLLKLVKEEEKEQLKNIVFNNILLKAVPDQRKFVRDLKNLIKNDTYQSYFEEQSGLGETVCEKLEAADIRNKTDLDRFCDGNTALRDKIADSMETALLRSRAQQLSARPSENAAKCIALMMDIDPRLFPRLDEEDKKNFAAELDELSKVIEGFRRLL